MTKIYLDNAATTALDPDVLTAMMPYLAGFVGNPSSVHEWGRTAKRAIERAREQVAQGVGAPAPSLVFTSGATEANHLAIMGHIRSLPLTRRHIVVSAIEHHSVLETCTGLQDFNVTVSLVNPDAEGRIHEQSVLDKVRPETGLVAVMAVNNELGTIQPVERIARAVKTRDPAIRVHSDMVQALGSLKLDLRSSSIDSASFSAHKIHGPLGVGALYLNPATPWQRTVYGGAQERNRRAGTENLAGIVGFGVAVQRLHRLMNRVEDIAALRDHLWDLLSTVPGVRRNTPFRDVVPGILNMAIEGIPAVQLLTRLDIEGLAASAGSACTAGSVKPSHVLLACGQSEAFVSEAFRLSLSDATTGQEIQEAAQLIRQVVLPWIFPIQ